MAPAHQVQTACTYARDARTQRRACLIVVVRSQLIWCVRPAGRAVGGAQLPQAILGEVTVERCDRGDISLIGPEFLEIDVVCEHGVVRARTMIETMTVAQLVR